MTNQLQQQLALMREQASHRHLPQIIRDDLLRQIAVLETTMVILNDDDATASSATEQQHVPFSIKRRKSNGSR
jgi:hypothetical protein